MTPAEIEMSFDVLKALVDREAHEKRRPRRRPAAVQREVPLQ
jgi:hypothetical protein